MKEKIGYMIFVDSNDVTLSQQVITVYCIAGKFGGGKVWRIWQIVRDSPN